MSSPPGSTDRSLGFADLDPDPLVQFERWFADAREVNRMPEAMTLATVGEDGIPDARMVLLKSAGPDGFHFFTNYEGVKAGQLARTPAAALVFHWPELDRQVRVRGRVERLSAEESDAYYATRGRASQIGAWASPQSRELEPGRESLDRLAAEAGQRFSGVDPVPRPPHWGGYRLVPERIEFWQGRQARLHDRFVYRRTADGWTVTRLAP